MLKGLQKAQALREFRGLRVALTEGGLKGVVKARSLKRFRELRVLLGGENASVPSAGEQHSTPTQTSNDPVIQKLQLVLSSADANGTKIGSALRWNKQGNTIKISGEFTFKRNTPTGFVTDNRSNLSLFINQLNNKVFEFAKTEGLAVIGAMSEAKFSTAIKNAAEAKESSLDNSGESVYSEMEQYLYVDDLAALEVRANQNPLYQSVIDGAPITRELLVELEQAGQQEAEPVSNNQLTQATTIAVEFMQSMVQQAMEAA